MISEGDIPTKSRRYIQLDDKSIYASSKNVFLHIPLETKESLEYVNEKGEVYISKGKNEYLPYSKGIECDLYKMCRKAQIENIPVPGHIKVKELEDDTIYVTNIYDLKFGINNGKYIITSKSKRELVEDGLIPAMFHDAILYIQDLLVIESLMKKIFK